MELLKPRLIGLLEIFTAAFIWGSIAIFALLSNLPSPIFVFYRVLVVSLISIVITRSSLLELLGFLRERYVLISSMMLTLNWVLFFWAVELVPVATAVFIYYTGPVFAAILAAIILKEKPSLVGSLAIVLALVGVALMLLTSGWIGGEILGVVVALGSGLAYGLLSVSSKLSSTSTQISPLSLVFLQSIVAVILLSPSHIVFEYTLSTKTILIVVIVGIIHTLIALYLWYDSLKRLEVYIVSTISYLDPVFATILAYLLLEQVPQLYNIAGGILILIGGVLVSIETLKK